MTDHIGVTLNGGATPPARVMDVMAHRLAALGYGGGALVRSWTVSYEVPVGPPPGMIGGVQVSYLSFRNIGEFELKMGHTTWYLPGVDLESPDSRTDRDVFSPFSAEITPQATEICRTRRASDNPLMELPAPAQR